MFRSCCHGLLERLEIKGARWIITLRVWNCSVGEPCLVFVQTQQQQSVCNCSQDGSTKLVAVNPPSTVLCCTLIQPSVKIWGWKGTLHSSVSVCGDETNLWWLAVIARSSWICAALGNGAQAAHGANWGQRLLNSEFNRPAQPVGKGSLWAGQTGHTGFQTLSYRAELQGCRTWMLSGRNRTSILWLKSLAELSCIK